MIPHTGDIFCFVLFYFYYKFVFFSCFINLVLVLLINIVYYYKIMCFLLNVMPWHISDYYCCFHYLSCVTDHKSVKCMDRVQGMLIKTALGLPKNRRNSPLLAALGIEKIEQVIKRQQLSL